MVLLDLFICTPDGEPIEDGGVGNVNFETPPRVGETVRYVDTQYRVVWVSHEYDYDGQDGYQLRIGITQVT